jgi:molybdopterin synthase sulfur carrier subunit
MATVSVLFFGGLRDALGISGESLDLPEEIRTVADLRSYLAARHCAYADGQACIRIARNEAFALDDERLSTGDVIALIPPVAGG